MNPRVEAQHIIVTRTQNALRMMRAAHREKPNPELARKIAERERLLEKFKRG